jgi:hypothetical protein
MIRKEIYYRSELVVYIHEDFGEEEKSYMKANLHFSTITENIKNANLIIIRNEMDSLKMSTELFDGNPPIFLRENGFKELACLEDSRWSPGSKNIIDVDNPKVLLGCSEKDADRFKKRIVVLVGKKERTLSDRRVLVFPSSYKENHTDQVKDSIDCEKKDVVNSICIDVDDDGVEYFYKFVYGE